MKLLLYLDAMMNRYLEYIKNHKYLGFIVAIGIATITLGNLTDSVTKINLFINSDSNKKPKLRINYYRMKGIAPNFLIKGMLINKWEKVLGGQHEIVNNKVLADANYVLNLFSEDLFGDLLYSDIGKPVINSKYSNNMYINEYADKISSTNYKVKWGIKDNTTVPLTI